MSTINLASTPPEQPSVNCGTCVYSEPSAGRPSWIWCRRFPPAWDHEMSLHMWPHLPKNEWCGCWTHRTATGIVLGITGERK